MRSTQDFWWDVLAPGWTSPAVAAIFAALLTIVVAIINLIGTARQNAKLRRQTADEAAKTRSHAKELSDEVALRDKAAAVALDSRFREYTGRDQWWSRFTWALNEFNSDSENRRQIGLLVIGSLVEARWVNDDDVRLARRLLTERTAHVQSGEGQ
jgi:hypothetical protein